VHGAVGVSDESDGYAEAWFVPAAVAGKFGRTVLCIVEELEATVLGTIESGSGAIRFCRINPRATRPTVPPEDPTRARNASAIWSSILSLLTTSRKGPAIRERPRSPGVGKRP
jgi:hypothetical protein